MAKEIRVWGEGRTELWSFGESVDIPADYVEVPSGDPFLTRTIKSIAETVYVRMQKNKRGGYSSAVGLFAPPDVVLAARTKAEQTAPERDERRQKGAVYRATKERKVQAGLTKILLERFPGMPEDEAPAIVARAFEVGSGRVGRTSKLSGDDKLAMAVKAHIRHTHTRYDQLLQFGWDRDDAREAVWARVSEVYERWLRPKKCDEIQ